MPAEGAKPRRPDQLPPGRHGIPREQIVESQRARMLQAVLEAVAAEGYQDTRVTDVIARAGVSRKTFYEHFDEKEECFLAAYDRELTQLTEEVAAAFFGEEGATRPWADQVRDGVRAFLRYLAERPAAARVCMVDAMGAGARGDREARGGAAQLHLPDRRRPQRGQGRGAGPYRGGGARRRERADRGRAPARVGRERRAARARHRLPDHAAVPRTEGSGRGTREDPRGDRGAGLLRGPRQERRRAAPAPSASGSRERRRASSGRTGPAPRTRPPADS